MTPPPDMEAVKRRHGALQNADEPSDCSLAMEEAHADRRDLIAEVERLQQANALLTVRAASAETDAEMAKRRCQELRSDVATTHIRHLQEATSRLSTLLGEARDHNKALAAENERLRNQIDADRKQQLAAVESAFGIPRTDQKLLELLAQPRKTP